MTDNSADFSLASNGRTYIERAGEVAQVFERIQKSSASVIGIAGVRGAGKSSLAKKILHSSAEAGYFTLLIPSPTSYEPREFLLAIFQRIVEGASEKVGSVIEGVEDLADKGKKRARQILLATVLLLAGLVASLPVLCF